MDLEPHVTPPTIRAIYAAYEARRAAETPRGHLGASQIGKECDRELWLAYRHAETEEFDGRKLRLFNTGHREEDRIIADLRAAGVTVWDRDPATGKQFTYTAVGGDFSCSLDGVGQGFAESTKPHTLEFKTMNDKNFKAIKNVGLEKFSSTYWAQVQVGMHLADLDRCYFIAVNKNTDEIYGERVRYDAACAMKYLARAERIIKAEQPPAKISDDPAFFGCKFCAFRQTCHGNKPPTVNCRTCAHVDVNPWGCKVGKVGTVCGAHIFNPYILGWEITDAGEGWIEYVTPWGEVIRNGDGNSEEIRNAWVPF